MKARLERKRPACTLLTQMQPLQSLIRRSGTLRTKKHYDKIHSRKTGNE